MDKTQALYGLNTPVPEHDACGTGYIIDTKDNRALEYALNLVVKNDHRIGRNPSRPGDTVPFIGDGAGVVTEIPFHILEDDIPQLEGRKHGSYGVARIYLPGNPAARAEAEKTINADLTQAGFTEIGRRQVKGKLSILAESVRPVHEHIFDIAFNRPDGMTDEGFRRAMYDCQMKIEQDITRKSADVPGIGDTHVGAISDRITVYKGIFSAEQLGNFFDDFKDDFQTKFAFYHGRYATNAATRLPNVHPFIKGNLALGHNGEIVTIKGNRERLERSVRDVTHDEKFAIPQGLTDSHTLAYALAFTANSRNISADDAMRRLVSAGWRKDVRLSKGTKEMMEAITADTAPYAGPAYVGFVDARGPDIKLNSVMDFAGLRPCTIMHMKDGTIITGSENALPDNYTMNDVAKMRSLNPLEQVQFDVNTGQETANNTLLKDMVARNKEATKLFQKRLVPFKASPLPTEAAMPDGDGSLALEQKQFALGHDSQTYKNFAVGMAVAGMPPVGAMGKATPAWFVSDVPAGLTRAAKDNFSIVTAPPHDAKREGYLMDMTTYLGDLSDDKAKVIKLPSAILPYGGVDQLKKQMGDKRNHMNYATLDCTFDATQDFASFRAELKKITEEAVHEVRDKHASVLILSDMHVTRERQPIDNMLIAALVHKTLDKEGLRDKVSLVFDAGSIRTEHDAFMLLTNGMDAVSPTMHYAAVMQAAAKKDKDLVGADDKPVAIDKALANAQKGMEKGIINAISRCGIPSLSAARDAQLFSFEGVRVAPQEEELWQAFGGNNPVYSPLQVYGLKHVWDNAVLLHEKALTVAKDKPLPDIKDFFQQGQDKTFGPAQGISDLSSMKEFADRMGDFRTHFTVLSKNISRDVMQQVRALAPSDEKLPPEIKKQITDSLNAEFGDRSKPYLRALDNISVNEVKFYDDWKQIRDISPVVGVQVAGRQDEHHRKLTQIGEAPKEEIFYSTKPLSMLKPEQVDAFTLRDSHRFAFKALEDFERTHPRGLMDMLFVKDESKHAKPIAAHDIAKHCYIASMSMGALTPAANRALSQVANSVGIRKETGEGGMPPKDQNIGVREDNNAHDRVIQIGSARFGVDISFVISPDRWVDNKFVPGSVTIKMAQGAKPGEGGQLPGEKVTPLIAALRSAFPGVALPSPAPHHDIYSIEDLYQLVRDCKRTAVKGVERPIGVKIASSGPDVFAVGLGVAKMGVDYITYAAGDGGTGAGPLTSINHTGRMMEDAILLSRKLDEAGFVHTPKRYYEGGIKTPLDFVRATCAGYDDVGFGSAAAIAEGCKWLQLCNKPPGCSPGVANKESAFNVDPDAAQEYFLSFMHGVSDILSKMGAKSLADIRGHTELLKVIEPEQAGIRKGGEKPDWKDLHTLIDIAPNSVPKPDSKFVRKPNPDEQKWYQLEDWAMGRIADLATDSKHLNTPTGKQRPGANDWTTEQKGKTTIVHGQTPISADQFMGPGVSALVATVNSYLNANPDSTPQEIIRNLRLGEPLETFDKQEPNREHPVMWRGRNAGSKTAPSLEVNLKVNGHGAQSFGAFTGDGVNYDVTGSLQYGAFKMASGGEHTIRSPLGRDGMAAGNSFGLGARGGFFAIEGDMGPRAGVRNAGASYVIDGDVKGGNAFTFMSRGSVVLLGDPGINFGGGSSGGIMAVYHPKGAEDLASRCDMDNVNVHALSAHGYDQYSSSIREMLEKHVKLMERNTNGEQHDGRAKKLLKRWDKEKGNFYLVIPKAIDKDMTKLSATEKETLRREVRTAYTKPDGIATEPTMTIMERPWSEKLGLQNTPQRQAIAL